MKVARSLIQSRTITVEPFAQFGARDRAGLYVL
jgi:hypothetical protein